MPKDAGGSADDADHVVLRWSDAASAVWREQFAQIVDAGSLEAVLMSTWEIPTDTKVRLIGREYSGEGTVRSCKREGALYRLCISTGAGQQGAESSEFDPGLFAVESFLTEEQEAKILKDLEDDDWDSVNFLSHFRPGWVLGKFAALIRDGFASVPAG